MARPKKNKIELTDDELKSLKSVIRKIKHPKQFDADARSLLTWMSPTEKY